MTLAILTASILIILDYSVGFWNGVGETRRLSHKFRSEAVPLETATRHLLPNLDHRYPADDRPADDPYYQGDAPRSVRTGPDGLVRGPQDAISAWRSILFLGGSTTENNEVDEPYRFPYLVGSLISTALGADVAGINAGVRGHTTQESLSVFLNHPAKAIDTASIVVVMHNINDRLLLALRGTYRSELEDVSSLSAAGILRAFLNTLHILYQNAKYSSNFLFLLDRVISERLSGYKSSTVSEEQIDLPDKSISVSRELFAENLETLIAAIRAKKKLPVLMTQPLGRESKWQDEFNEVIRRVGAKHRILVIDLDEEIKRERRSNFFYPDSIHFNNSGSVWAAKLIAEKLKSDVFLGKTRALDANGIASHRFSCSDEADAPNSTAARRLDLEGRYPTFSRSGDKLLYKRYFKGGSAIGLYDLRTGATTVLKEAKNPDELKHPTWGDQAGTSILYVAKYKQTERLYRLTISSGAEIALTPEFGFVPAIPAVFANGDIVFAGYTVGSEGKTLAAPDLFLITKKSGAMRKITDTPWEEWRPAASPDSKSLYFISDADGSFDIYRMNLTSKRITKIVDSESDKWDPAISPDGRWLAYASRGSGNFDLYLLDLFGGRVPIRLTSSIEDEWDPSFSADGKSLIYATTSAGGSRIRGLCLHSLIQQTSTQASRGLVSRK